MAPDLGRPARRRGGRLPSGSRRPGGRRAACGVRRASRPGAVAGGRGRRPGAVAGGARSPAESRRRLARSPAGAVAGGEGRVSAVHLLNPAASERAVPDEPRVGRKPRAWEPGFRAASLLELRRAGSDGPGTRRPTPFAALTRARARHFPRTRCVTLGSCGTVRPGRAFHAAGRVPRPAATVKGHAPGDPGVLRVPTRSH